LLHKGYARSLKVRFAELLSLFAIYSLD
jgi:hypothetical protein